MAQCAVHPAAARLRAIVEILVSLGGILGMLFAAERPRRVRTLSLVSAPVYLNRELILHCTQPAACAAHVLHFAAQHDGVACHE
ncbi:MAG: hypothetical protein HYY79_06645 [Betaproteobacteria bacterium]|nr:hypothetical protein [Betaproteobacteria bacterium]